MKTRFLGLVTALVVAGSLTVPQTAFAHCDTVDGPVAQAALKALETGNVNIPLAYAPPAAEPEIRAQFERARKVRALGPEARALADHSFMETVVRLHRAGEGAAFEGLKPAGIDHGPAIPAAEAAVKSGDLSKIRSILVHDVEFALEQRLKHVRATQGAPAEARTPEDIARVRARVSAELGFVTFAETLRQAAHGVGTVHHED
jgi:hypothetical protein